MPRVNPSTLKSIVYLGAENKVTGEIRTGGTAFILKLRAPVSNAIIPDVYALITARHNLENLKRWEDWEIAVRFNCKDGTSFWRKTLIEDWDIPESESTDVAAYVCKLPSNIDHLSLDWNFISAVHGEADLSASEDVVILGLFGPHSGAKRLKPIVRLGSIAAVADPEDCLTANPWPGKNIEGIVAHLVEIRSIGGLSGSPVFYHRPSKSGIRLRLLGLVSGHFPYSEQRAIVSEKGTEYVRELNSGIAYVTPVSEIVALLENLKFEERKTRLFFPIGSDVTEGSLLSSLRNVRADQLVDLIERIQTNSQILPRVVELAGWYNARREKLLDAPISADDLTKLNELFSLISDDSLKATMELIKQADFRAPR